MLEGKHIVLGITGSIAAYKACLIMGREWIVTLVPKRKDALRMWSSLRLHYRPDMRCATSIEMNEPSGDLTVIEFKNIKTEFK